MDGLRAVAVLCVMFFHADLGFPGGYVGVDVFFVISGYLITSLIVKDLQTQSFSLVGFWERRARRILPPLAVVVVVCIIAGYFLLLPADYSELGKSAGFQAVFLANVYFWKKSGYFGGPAEEMPLLHTWSLAVEEQFYLILPLALIGLFMVPAFRQRGVLLAALGVMFVISFALSVYAVPRHPSGAFYLLPSRAWELLAGSLLGLLPAACFSRRDWLRETMVYLGMGLILSSVFLYVPGMFFPGWAALPPCLGTVLIIWGNHPTGSLPQDGRLTSLGRLLAARPVVFVGLISYSLYLWHWPLFAFSNYLVVEAPSVVLRVGLLLLGLALAVLSWRYVETPFRKKSLCADRRGIFAFSGSVLTCSAALGIGIVFMDGLPQRLSEKVRTYQLAEEDRDRGDYRSLAEVKAGNLERFGVEGVGPSILLWGDSHSQVIKSALDDLARDMEMSGEVISYPQTAPLLGRFSGRLGMRQHSREWAEAAITHVRQNQIKHTFLAARWEMYLGENVKRWELGDGESCGRLETAFLKTVRALNQAGSKVWLISQVPSHPERVPRALAFSEFRGIDKINFQTPKEEHKARLAAVMRLSKLAAGLDVEILDPAPLFLDEESGTYHISIDGSALYYDKDHLSLTAVETLISPWLRERVDLRSDRQLK